MVHVLCVEGTVDVTSDIAFDTAPDFTVGFSLLSSSRDVCSGFFVMGHFHIATMCIALLSFRSPPRLSRCLTVLPDDAGIGLTPASEANSASVRTPAVVRPSRETLRDANGTKALLLQQRGCFTDLDKTD